MGQGNLKALRKANKRVLQGYLEDIHGYLKPKPAWLPWWFWTRLQGIVIHLDKFTRKQ